MDVTQNYGSAFYSCAAGMALSALFLGLVKPAKRILLCRKRNLKHETREKEVDSDEQSAVKETHKTTDSPEECFEVDDNQQGATQDLKEVIRFA